ncbi:hypothetical protein GF357_04460 [Candidatus Dojkabacteria bacterium]|nr:hypothetical protein [Candidatus Dojkabacteria bacterium]
MKKVAIMFGGVSSEHEVSIITGLQIAEKVDRNKFEPVVIYVDKKGRFRYYPGFKSRRDFKEINPLSINFSRDEKGSYIYSPGVLGKKIYLDCVYLAFHGGLGEGGSMQGFLDILDLPYTSPDTEGSVVGMSKVIGKEILRNHKIPLVDDIVLTDNCCRDEKQLDSNVEKVVKKLELPVIIKPAHFGSSIGIEIAKTEIELTKGILAAAQLDSEILIEKFLKGIQEYNISVRTVNNSVAVSEIEKPLAEDEILSFMDKYGKGGKKNAGGMASLVRELPAKISEKEKKLIVKYAKTIYKALRCNGLVRIDFMKDETGDLYFTEINTIPGSMSFYLWEASGVPFTQQITESIEQAFHDYENRVNKYIEYESDIVDKWIGHGSDSEG